MTQNMFQEGLHHVYFKETPSPQPLAAATTHEELKDVRIHRWFGTVVNIRLLVSGLLQVFGALACILSTVTHACVSYGCSIYMVTPVWSSLFYLATGCLTVEVQRKPSKLKVATLMGLDLFSVLLGFCALLAYSISSVHPIDLKTKQQRVGAHIAKGSSIAFTLQCLLASIYVLFVSWRGLRRYSGNNSENYNRLPQEHGDGTRLLEEEEVFSL